AARPWASGARGGLVWAWAGGDCARGARSARRHRPAALRALRNSGRRPSLLCPLMLDELETFLISQRSELRRCEAEAVSRQRALDEAIAGATDDLVCEITSLKSLLATLAESAQGLALATRQLENQLSASETARARCSP